MDVGILEPLVRLAWLLGAVAFVLGLIQMNSPATARNGNLLSAGGMAGGGDIKQMGRVGAKAIAPVHERDALRLPGELRRPVERRVAGADDHEPAGDVQPIGMRSRRPRSSPRTARSCPSRSRSCSSQREPTRER